MIDKSSIINFGDLSKPATVLIEKVSDAIGGGLKPWQIKRVAKAQAEAEKIKALAKVEISEIEQRGLARFIAEEGIKQVNMESITRKALEDVKEDAHPENMENDWIANFFDRCRLISDEEMQSLWARVLAGEANNPGTYSKRTVNFISSIDKSDAMLFTNLCSYTWVIGDIVPLIYDPKHEIYMKNEMHWNALTHLDEIGLITFKSLMGVIRRGLPEVLTVFYYGTPINIKFKKRENNEMNIGLVILSQIGQELAPISGAKPIPEFLDFVLTEWSTKGYVTFSDWPYKRMQAIGRG